MTAREASSALDTATAESMVRTVHPEAVVTEVHRITGGQVNEVYEIRCAPPVPPVVAKRYSAQTQWKAAKEDYVLGLLAAAGIGPLPRVLHRGPDFLLQSRVEGTMLSDLLPELEPAQIRDTYRELGRLLASIHRIPQPSFGYLMTRVVSPHDSNRSLMRQMTERVLASFAANGGDPALHAALERVLTGDQTVLYDNCTAPVLCHNDFHDGNVMVVRTATGLRMTGLLDFENALAADPLLDLAKTDLYSRIDDPELLAALLDGYGPLPPDGAERLALYKLYHAMELWSWLAGAGVTEPLPQISQLLSELLSAFQPRPAPAPGSFSGSGSGSRSHV